MWFTITPDYTTFHLQIRSRLPVSRYEGIKRGVDICAAHSNNDHWLSIHWYFAWKDG